MMNLPKIRGKYTFNASLAPHTWLKVGGKADVLFEPDSIEDLQHFMKNLPPSIPWTVLGKASNLLIRDGGITGIVIKLNKRFSHIHVQDCILHVGANAFDSTVAQEAWRSGIGGLEFLCNIPGSIGGGVVMNAGAYGKNMQSILKSLTLLKPNGELLTLDAKDLTFQYRNCLLPEKGIIVEAVLQGRKNDPEKIKKNMLYMRSKRRDTQPIKEKTCGSTFCNSGTKKAWELLDACGLRGAQHGKAQFSTKHCNFLINTGGATARDLETLGEIARQKVFARFGVCLQWEIKRIGNIV